MQTSNISNTEAYIRLSISFIILIISVAISCYLLMFLTYTGMKKHC